MPRRSGQILQTGTVLPFSDANDSLIGTTGDDLLAGQAGDDTLHGLAGNDTLDGGSGNDAMAGGKGDDTYVVDSLGDVVIEAAGGGTDTVFSSVTLTLGDTTEHLILTGLSDLDATGNALNNHLTGNAAANILFGDGGADTLQGGAGDDTYIIDGNDRILGEGRTDGVDTILSSASVNLPANFEYLYLTGTGDTVARGNNQANVIYGNSGNNYLLGGTVSGGPNGNDRLFGGDGHDTINGGGGKDRIEGGSGNDYLYADDGNDVAYGGTGDDYLMTNYGGDSLYGEEGNDVLSIGNPGGRELLSGGAGNDLLRAGLGSDATLVGGLGTDTVMGQLDGLTLISVEVWRLEGYAPFRATVAQLAAFDRILGGRAGIDIQVTDSGTVDLSAQVGRSDTTIRTTGDGSGVRLGSGNDYFVSNGAADTLNGGAGDDAFTIARTVSTAVLVGGTGTDLLLLSNQFDRRTLDGLTLTGIEVLDTHVPVSGTVAQFSQFTTIRNTNYHPVLTLTDAGTADFASRLGSATTEITASAFGNWITTGSGADTVMGGVADDTLNGGAGDDYLTGGAGRDSFAFNLALPTAGLDWVLDFTLSDDLIQLAGTGLAPGALDVSALRVNNTGHAVQPADRILYDRTTGTLSLDRDGSGPQAASFFAILAPDLALTADDFWVV